MEKNRVELKIYGNTYTILTEDDAEYVEELGELINKEMHAVSNESPTLSQTQCAVLVALDQADACKKQTARRLISEPKSRITLRMRQEQNWKLMWRGEKSKDLTENFRRCVTKWLNKRINEIFVPPLFGRH